MSQLDIVFLSDLDGGFQLEEEGGDDKEIERTHNHQEIWGYRKKQKIHGNGQKNFEIH